jgi:hypothetical protein
VPAPPDPEGGRTEHRASVAALVDSLLAVPAAAWHAPREGGKWSPAQVAEHLRLTYVVVNGELAGGAGLRLRSSAFLRLFLRLAYLPRILRTGRLPRPALAPREVRPGPGPYDLDEMALALQALAAEFERLVVAKGPRAGAVVTHHLFGTLSAAQAWRFVAVHNEHHRLQLERGT